MLVAVFTIDLDEVEGFMTDEILTWESQRGTGIIKGIIWGNIFCWNFEYFWLLLVVQDEWGRLGKPEEKKCEFDMNLITYFAI